MPAHWKYRPRWGDYLSPRHDLSHGRVQGLTPHHNSVQNVMLITQSAGRSRDRGKAEVGGGVVRGTDERLSGSGALL